MRRGRLVLGLAVVGLVTAARAAPHAPGGDLAARLAGALSTPALRGARVAALVVDRDSGATLFSLNPDRSMVPASNQKLFTAVAALHAFGPTHRFVTEVLADAAPDADGAVETLYVRGGGDPAVTSEDFWRLASDLRRAGLDRVRGDLVLDDSAFDHQRWHPSWGKPSSRAYHAPVGGLTVNYGAFAVVIEPGSAAGQGVRARIDPAVPFLHLVNRAETGPPHTRRSLQVDRSDGSRVEQVIVSGSMPAGASAETFERSVLDPAAYAGAVLRMQLEAVGIQVGGETRAAAVPEAAIPLLAFEGKPLAEVVRSFLKYSNNSIGEALVKQLGARASGGPGCWRDGVTALRGELTDLGIPVDQLVLVDGSGLSYEDRATPRALVAALRRGAESFRFGPEFIAALPIAAADGTLEDRAEAALGRVRAKTGLLTQVTSLSGMAELEDGHVAYFSVLVNGFRRSAGEAMGALDGFAETLIAGQERLAGGL
jgi:serine-type D-Ala-D-Ala carboxypeptidase/endopeptidase (penicillin-binding protein 4)